ncbi:MAG: tRNA 2-thiocytidine biosynthesis TtcA family protein [Anaeroplasmataceae bacterium]
MNVKENFERDIIKKYRNTIWSKFIKAIKAYNLISPGDKIAVAISGGKDSLLMAKLLEELKKHGDFDFDIEYISMDPGFSELNKKGLKDNCDLLGIPVKIFDSNVFEVASKMNPEKPCYMCARMRRGFLYSKAQELGCNKLALGHHFNDIIETTMINILYAGSFKTMVPKAISENYSNMQLIRPMYLIKEEDIIKIMNNNYVIAMNCGCTVASGETESKRKEVKQLIAQLRKTHNIVDQNIFMSASNVNTTAIIGTKDESGKHDFNELFEILEKNAKVKDHDI